MSLRQAVQISLERRLDGAHISLVLFQTTVRSCYFLFFFGGGKHLISSVLCRTTATKEISKFKH